MHGLVLRSVDTKESDKILTLLTAEQGRLTATAKGALGRRSRVAAAVQLLAYSELTLSKSHGWLYVNAGSSIALFNGVRQDITLLSLGCYLAELTEAVCCGNAGNTEDGAFLPLLLNALYALGTLHRPPPLVKAAYELRLMAQAGFAPLVDACAVCGVENPSDPVLDLAGGVICCRACRHGGGSQIPLTPAALSAIRYVLSGNAKRLYHFTLPAKDREIFSRAAEAYARACIDRELPTLAFYKSVR